MAETEADARASGPGASEEKASPEVTEAQAAPKPRARRPRKKKGPTPEEVARSYFDAVAARDPDAMVEHWHEEGVDDLVPVAVLRGPADIRSFFAQTFAAIPDMEFVVERITSDERVAAVEWRSSGTFSGAPFQGIEATGRRVELRGVDCLEVEDGKIVRNTAYYDGAAFARAIGMLPPRDSGAERAMYGAFNALTRVRTTLRERRSR